MEALFENQRVIFEQFEKERFYDRGVMSAITLDNAVTGIVGVRGIGKTTNLLKQALMNGAKERRALYVSADDLYFLDNKLVDLVKQLYQETDVTLLCIDEVHKYPNWAQELKNIADKYKRIRVLFTGSSSIDIVHGKYDLSRRVTLHHLYGFSFREYLEFYLDCRVDKITMQELVSNHVHIAESLKVKQILKHFNEYLRTGYYPFFRIFSQEREKFQAIENTTQKTIYEDIATLRVLKTPTLMLLEKLFKYVLNSLPGELSVYKLANTVGKDFESITEYLALLQQSGLIRYLYPKKAGKAQMRNPQKMYPENTNLIYASHLARLADVTLGKARETFVINQLQNTGHDVFYSSIGDFDVDGMIFEVGGKSKTNQQIKGQKNAFILADGIMVGVGNKIPLYLLGLLY